MNINFKVNNRQCFDISQDKFYTFGCITLVLSSETAVACLRHAGRRAEHHAEPGAVEMATKCSCDAATVWITGWWFGTLDYFSIY
jgi:hypothetical protein